MKAVILLAGMGSKRFEDKALNYQGLSKQPDCLLV